MTKLKQLTFAIFTIFTLNGCKQKNSEAETPGAAPAPQAKESLMSLYQYTRYENNIASDDNGISYFTGQTFMATNANPTFESIATPQTSNCYYTADTGLSIRRSRLLEVGDVTIKNAGVTKTIKAEAGDPPFAAGLLLAPGEYSMETTGYQGSMQLKHTLIVPASPRKILISSGAYLKQGLDSTPGTNITINRAAGFSVELEGAPENADYMQIYVRDYTVEGKVSQFVCYAPIDGPFTVPPNWLGNFNGKNAYGSISVDLVSINWEKNVGKIVESLVMGVHKFYHGTMVIPMEDQNQVVQFGDVTFE